MLIDFNTGCPKYPTSCGGYSISSEGGEIQATEHISKEPFSCDWVLVEETLIKQIIINFSVGFYSHRESFKKKKNNGIFSQTFVRGEYLFPFFSKWSKMHLQ